MNRPALLVLVRHGQSQRNVVKKRNRYYLDDESRRSVKGVPDHLIAYAEAVWSRPSVQVFIKHGRP